MTNGEGNRKPERRAVQKLSRPSRRGRRHDVSLPCVRPGKRTSRIAVARSRKGAWMTAVWLERSKYVFDAVLQIEDSRGQCVVLDPDEWPSTFELGTAISGVADALEKAGDFRAETEKPGLNVRSLLRRLRRAADQKPETRSDPPTCICGAPAIEDE